MESVNRVMYFALALSLAVISTGCDLNPDSPVLDGNPEKASSDKKEAKPDHGKHPEKGSDE